MPLLDASIQNGFERSGKAIDPGPTWVEAYLLLEQIIYSFTSMAIGRQHPISPEMSIGHFADWLLAFIETYQ